MTSSSKRTPIANAVANTYSSARAPNNASRASVSNNNLRAQEQRRLLQIMQNKMQERM